MKLIFDIHAYWHSGSGRGKGQSLNMLVCKTKSGLPMLPGRSVKGLVRDALLRAEHWGQVPEDFTETLMGMNSQAKNLSRYEAKSGHLAFDDASLPKELCHWLTQAAEPYAECFYQEIFSTSIDLESGTAKDGSLRGKQVTIPLQLEAPMQVMDESTLLEKFPNWQTDFVKCLTLVRGLGVARTRGYGRCSVTLEVNS